MYFLYGDAIQKIPTPYKYYPVKISYPVVPVGSKVGQPAITSSSLSSRGP